MKGYFARARSQKEIYKYESGNVTKNKITSNGKITEVFTDSQLSNAK